MARRLLFSYFALIIVTLLLLTFAALRITQQMFLEFRQSQSILYTELLPEALGSYYDEQGDWAGIQREIERIALANGMEVTLTNTESRVLASTNTEQIGQPIPDDVVVTLMYPVTDQSTELLGTLYLETGDALRSLDDTFLLSIVRAFLPWASGIVLLTIGIGILFTRSISKPMTEMSLASAQIARGNYATHVPIRGNDEISALGHAFNRMAEDLESMERLRRDMVMNVSHDLRTPLTVICAYLEGLLSGQIADRDSAVEAFTIMSSEVNHLLNLVENLNQVAALDSGSMPLDSSHVEVFDLVEDAVNRVRPLLSTKQIAITTNVAEELPLLYIDSKQMGQVLFNLLENAVRYTPEQGQIAIHAQTGKGGIYLYVDDNGEGIDPKYQPYIFERFYRADPTRNRQKGGAGLGLSIVHSIIEAHGGKITVHSYGIPGKGTRFAIYLPLRSEG